ncbi:MAG: MerC family mercury resistance protein, partial [Opitutae bacterium]|nr:MerC family mercury resistance protein [Opitutae bacterium]
MKSITWRAFDRMGMTLSMACAIHCLAMPVLIPLLPLLAGSFLT